MYLLLKFCLSGCVVCIKIKEKEICPSVLAFTLFCKGYLNILLLNPSPVFYNINNCWESIYASTGIQIDLPESVLECKSCSNCSIVVLHQSLLLWCNILPTGEFPVISPGKVYEYTSCTTFSTTSGYMEGYYTFHCLYYKDRFFNVTIPRFHMVCPTFKVSTAWMVSRDAVG